MGVSNNRDAISRLDGDEKQTVVLTDSLSRNPNVQLVNEPGLINAYKRVAGEAIFEIGRRLKHVKENDLVHGQWSRWCSESIGMDRKTADKFIVVFDELGGDDSTSSQIGISALYEIATLPPEERTREHTLKKRSTKWPYSLTSAAVRAAYSISSNTRISIAGGCVSSSNSSGSSGSILRLASARASVLLAVCGDDTPMASAISLSVRPSSRSLSAVSSRLVSVSAEGAVAGRNFPSADSTFPTASNEAVGTSDETQRWAVAGLIPSHLAISLSDFPALRKLIAASCRLLSLTFVQVLNIDPLN